MNCFILNSIKYMDVLIFSALVKYFFRADREWLIIISRSFLSKEGKCEENFSLEGDRESAEFKIMSKF